ncbi:HypC/HybG/HupF family hydrogenase formation chaperone [Magnetovibrio blakemorei]|uniref:HypC/HybG/HupF family hydrogenase formation chaperone n=1 Tax=Magnetovibrio blakemorei TaxID=28181 RepID=UPI00147C81E8|nr:HypC/HybG/HupF family hydrogenase formation chaperone [Magnetovibrio blakemorei]
MPLKIVEAGDFVARGEGRNGIEDVNLMLIGSQPVGTWVLNFLGSAREVISEQDAAQINSALDGLTAIMNGEETIDVDRYFPDIANL